MALEKQTTIRKIEFVFTDDQIHPEANVLFVDVILEDGIAISTTNRTAKASSEDAKQLLRGKTTYTRPSALAEYQGPKPITVKR